MQRRGRAGAVHRSISPVQRIGWIARWRVGRPWSPPTRTGGTGRVKDGRFAETDTADPVLILTEVPTP